MLKGAIGAAAAGTAGAALSGPDASALAATTAGATAPKVVALTDAPTIAVDASLGNDLRVTINGNRTMGSPTNAVDGQQLIFQITQGAGGPFTVTWADAYQFSTSFPAPALSSKPGQTDLLGFLYDRATATWLLAGYVPGFS